MPVEIDPADELAAAGRHDDQAAPPVPNVPPAAGVTIVTTGPEGACRNGVSSRDKP